jgi:hypothetical protein
MPTKGKSCPDVDKPVSKDESSLTLVEVTAGAFRLNKVVPQNVAKSMAPAGYHLVEADELQHLSRYNAQIHDLLVGGLIVLTSTTGRTLKDRPYETNPFLDLRSYGDAPVAACIFLHAYPPSEEFRTYVLGIGYSAYPLYVKTGAVYMVYPTLLSKPATFAPKTEEPMANDLVEYQPLTK